MELPLSDILYILLFFVINVIQTITGFGGGVLIMPFAMALVGRLTAVGHMNLLGLPLSAFIAFRERAHIQWGLLARAVLLMALGIGGGMLVQRWFHFDFIYRIYGGFILLSVAVLAFRNKRAPFPPAVDCLLLLGAGALHQIFASGGPLLVIYAINRIRDKDAFRATIHGIWIPINLLSMAEHWRAGLYTAAFFNLSLLLIPSTALGIAAGYLLYRRVSAKMFLGFSYGLLFVMGLYILFS